MHARNGLQQTREDRPGTKDTEHRIEAAAAKGAAGTAVVVLTLALAA